MPEKFFLLVFCLKISRKKNFGRFSSRKFPRKILFLVFTRKICKQKFSRRFRSEKLPKNFFFLCFWQKNYLEKNFPSRFPENNCLDNFVYRFWSKNVSFNIFFSHFLSESCPAKIFLPFPLEKVSRKKFYSSFLVGKLLLSIVFSRKITLEKLFSHFSVRFLLKILKNHQICKNFEPQDRSSMKKTTRNLHSKNFTALWYSIVSRCPPHTYEI